MVDSVHLPFLRRMLWKWLHRFVLGLMVPPVGVELLNVYRTSSFGHDLIVLRGNPITACTRSVIGQIMTEQRAGELFITLACGSAAALLLGSMRLRFAMSLAGFFLWYVYTTIRLHCAPVPADALYKGQVAAYVVTTLCTAYWAFCPHVGPRFVEWLRRHTEPDER